MKRITIYLFLALLSSGLSAALAATPPPASASGEPISDVRVLIDVSGSMKHNDPQNLRASALRLIVGLLPPGARAGVWTFAQYVNMLVPEGTVDPRWRDAARHASHQIASNGLYTDIEAALKEAAWDWERPDPHTRRSIILLTDGLVDIPKGKAASADSRRRILKMVIGRLHQAGVTVYTLGLSDQADAPLLHRMAAGTGGWYERVSGADGLEKAFLHTFEKTTHRDTLPLVGNAVNVDAHIQELTLLIFRKDGDQPSRLITPAGHGIAQDSAPPTVRWHHESRYDLITIEHPQAGRWRLVADEDPDNRVMVVTNLEMHTSPLPNHVLAGHPVTVAVHFTEEGKTITRPAFLKFLDVRLTQSDDEGNSITTQMRDDGRPPDKAAGDGVYTASLGDKMAPGHHEVRVLVDGVTFQRQSQQLLSVESSPVITNVQPDDPVSPGAYILSVIPRPDLIDTRGMAVQAVITDPHGGRTTVDVPHADADEWRYTIPDKGDAGPYQVAVKVTAQAADGSPVHYETDPLSFGRAAAAPSAPTPAPIAAPVAAPPPAARPTPAPQPAAAVPPPAPRPDWSLAAVLILLLNLLVAGGAYGAYLWMHRSTALALRPLEEELL